MLIPRILFFIFSMIFTLFSCYLGILGGEQIGVVIFGQEVTGPASGVTLFQFFVLAFLFSIGVLVTGFGALFMVVMPLSFTFPKLAAPFGWSAKQSLSMVPLINWYASNLKSYAETIEKNA